MASSKRHILNSTQSEKFISSAASGSKDFLLNTAATARKLGKEVTSVTADGSKEIILSTAKGARKLGKEVTSVTADGSKEIILSTAATARKLGKEVTSATADGSKELIMSTAKGARKIGKDVLKRSNHSRDSQEEDVLYDHDYDDDSDDDHMDAADDLRWSIRPASKMSAAAAQHQGYDSFDEDDDDDDCYIDDKPSTELGKGSAHSHDLGTISEDDDDLISEAFTVNTEATGSTTASGTKKKKKKKKKKRSGVSPKRKLNRVQSERTGRSKSLDDSLEAPVSPKRGGLSRSKSSQSDRHMGTRDEPRRGGLKKAKSAQSERMMGAKFQTVDEMEIPRRTIRKTKSKKLKKGRSKSPMKIDFTGQVTGAKDVEEEILDEFDTETETPKKIPTTAEDDDSDSESYIDPIAKANRVAEELSGRTHELPSLRGSTEEQKEDGALDSFLMSGHNEHILGEEDSYFKTGGASRTSGGEGRSRPSIQSIQSRSSGRPSARPSLANKLRTSIFSESNSFMEELSSVNGDEVSTRKSLDQEKERVSKLLDELESYEKELSQEHSVLELEREALEFELDKQTNRNQELEATIDELKAKIEELESALRSEEDDLVLLAENEVLRKRLEQKEEAMLNMTSMHSLNASVPNFGDQMLSMASMASINQRSFSSDLPMVGEDDDLNAHMSMGTIGTDASDDDVEEKPSAKLQGKLLQARAKLSEKDRIMEAQAEEIKSLRREVEDYKDDEAREKMKSYIQGLEKEKKFFMAEIAKLKEANEKASAANEKASTINGTSNHSMGWGGGSNHSMPFYSAHTGGRQSITSTSTTHEDEFANEDSFSISQHASLSVSQQQTTNRRSSAATQQNPVDRRQSASAWRSFSTRLFGGVDMEEEPPVQTSTEADKMLDDLTKDL